jgi:Fe-S-cluster-containing dehydrogenase component
MLVIKYLAGPRGGVARGRRCFQKQFHEGRGEVSEVNHDKGISCMTCVHVCPYGAPFANVDGKARSRLAKCMGCGICVSECPRAPYSSPFRIEAVQQHAGKSS